jgi:AcrR family transcriptional regulator
MEETLRQRQRSRRNDAILDTAERLFIERGFGAVTFEEIASDACISRPTLYSHFRSKEEVVVELALRCLEQVNAYFQKMDLSLPATQRLNGFLDWAGHFRFGGGSTFVQNLAQYVFPLRQSGTALDEAENELIVALERLIRDAQEEGGVRSDVKAICLAGLMLASQHGWLDLLLADGRVRAEDIIQSWKVLLSAGRGEQGA